MSMVKKHFGPPLTECPIGELALLHHEGLIDDFVKRFMALSCCDTTIMEAHQVQLFIKGLGNPLCSNAPPPSTTRSCWPAPMSNVMWRHPPHRPCHRHRHGPCSDAGFVLWCPRHCLPQQLCWWHRVPLSQSQRPTFVTSHRWRSPNVAMMGNASTVMNSSPIGIS
jgi:hypothetical protein